VNVAARMGAWSAGHRKTAIIGWLVFVMAALVIGSSGTKQITNAEGSNGQSAKAEQILNSSGFPDAASENVLVQTRNGQPDDAALRSAVTQVVAAVTSTKLVDNVHSPLDADGESYVSHDGHSMLVTFDMTGDADSAASRVQPILDAVAAVQKTHSSLRIEEVGDASGEKALDKTLG
jgi:RND superfamily putative drug exporter